MEHPFADQCQDLAALLLANNLNSIQEDGTVLPFEGEESRLDEPGHAALAIGEFFRATGQTKLEGYDLVDLSARCITNQAFTEQETDNGIAYSGLGLLSFGPSKERNQVWERLVDITRERLDKMLLQRGDFVHAEQAYSIAKSVTRFSMELSKKDETGKLIEKFISSVQENSSAGFADADPDSGIGGCFDIAGVSSFVFIRQALQLHANIHLRERKLPSLRTFVEKYLRMIPDTSRMDGLGWSFGEAIGAYGQMHCISLILQAMRDDWITDAKKPLYLDVLRRLFYFFFSTYIDQEHGCLLIRDYERTTVSRHTLRMANFDAARYLSQWSRLARSIHGSIDDATPTPSKTSGRFVIFDKANKKEQGVFLYRDANSGLVTQLPLMNTRSANSCDSLAFPHAPGIFDWPVQNYLPVMVPELTFDGRKTVPCYYGKQCVTGLGLRNSFFFKYDQPELIDYEGKMAPGIGSVKVRWTFSGAKIQSEFVYTVKNVVQMDTMRYNLCLGLPHSYHTMPTSFKLGPESLRATVIKDDFQAEWTENEEVTNDQNFRGYLGNIHFVQTLLRDHPLIMRPGVQYKLILEFEPDIQMFEE
ncbi:MAG: hypothetical protein MI748_14075 [Opitutales bacterium]|nr:hypothetical protein [Opitutales bacterium]